MRKRIFDALNILMVVYAATFLGYGLYRFFHHSVHPELYIAQSAPWYTDILILGLITLIVVAIAAIIQLILRKKMK